ncbi:MAG: DUF1330 domain-containing protein [Myxococcota bacterium]
MSYLLVLNYDVIDAEKFAEYAKRSQSTMPPDMKVLAFDQTPNDLEGSSRQRLTIVEFPSEEAALRWYESDAYRAIRPLRLESTTGWLRGVSRFGA